MRKKEKRKEGLVVISFLGSRGFGLLVFNTVQIAYMTQFLRSMNQSNINSFMTKQDRIKLSHICVVKCKNFANALNLLW